MAKYGHRRRRYRKSRGFKRSYRKFVAGSELKSAHDELNSFGVTTSWAAANPVTTDALCAPGQGVDGNDRIGDRYSIESLYINGDVCSAEAESQTAPMAETNVRIVIGIAHNTDGAEVVPADVLHLGYNEDIFAMRKLSHTSEFTILSDQFLKLPAISLNEGAANLFAWPFRCQQFKYFKKFKKPLMVKCMTTGSTVASIQSNSLFCMCIAESQVTQALLSYQVRVRYRG